MRSAEPRPAEQVTTWDDEADVVVVGLGCAGACAAVEAAEAGVDVLVLEAAASGGGTSALSGGLVYLGGGTPLQAACGFDDTPDAMHAFLLAACGPGTDPAKVRTYCDGSVDHYHWLVEHGVPFRAAFCPEPNRESRDDAGLLFSGGEDTWPFTEVAPPAPRGHKPQFDDSAGGFLMARLLAAVGETPTRVVTGASAERLVVDRDGAVVGVAAHLGGNEHLVRARRAVVLAAGGFVADDAMLALHAPEALRCSYKVGTDRDDGHAIRMGQAVGGAAIHMDALECALPITPPRRIVRGILVNGHGQRFVNEDTYTGRIGLQALRREDGEVYFVHDDETYAVNFLGQRASWVGETAAELEAEIGLPPGSLEATIALYDRHAEHGEDPVFHKGREFVVPLRPPYGVIDLRAESTIYATFTLGGLRTTVDGEVLDLDGAAVPGLYAAGRTTSGIAVHGYVSGISLGDGTFFGRAAGRHAARRAATRA